MITRSVAIALSGGVDSAVAAAFLVDQGYDVIGVMLSSWSEVGFEEANRCCAPKTLERARAIAFRLGIPFYVLDVREIFRSIVVEDFLDSYSAGETPNPCILCNQKIRWGWLLDFVNKTDSRMLATGHYARIDHNGEGTAYLQRARDRNKDQTYMLSALDQTQLSQTLFPLGDFTKADVRQIARSKELEAAQIPDSQDLCFLGDGDYRGFLRRLRPAAVQPGIIVDQDGRALGEHEGLGFYTIGQRKGIRIAAEKPYYVLEKDVAHNTLIVGFGEQVERNEFLVAGMHWIAPEWDRDQIEAEVQIRYRALPVRASLERISEVRYLVRLEKPLRDIAPGQRAVFYQGAMCLGGGKIQINSLGGCL